MARPRKIKRPVGLEAALRMVLAKKRLEDRMKIFREWRRTVLRAELKREPTDQEMEAQVKLFREPDFDAANLHPFFWNELNDFVTVFHKENRRRKAHIAATTRWSKKKVKKTPGLVFSAPFCIKHRKTCARHETICAKHPVTCTKHPKTCCKHRVPLKWPDFAVIDMVRALSDAELIKPAGDQL